MIGTKFGLIKFLLLNNNKVWGLLTDKEKKIVLENNLRHNVHRSDYANPELYQQGTNFDTDIEIKTEARQRELIKFLNEKNPKSILEIGPGGGYYTKIIVNYPSVKQYLGTDINPAFLEFLKPRLDDLENEKHDFSYSLINGDFNTLIDLDIKADAIILMSTVHHIPDRDTLFKKLESLLSTHGAIFTADPAHSINRKIGLIKKILDSYNSPEYYKNPTNYDTHHFCTVKEYNEVINKIKGLEISRIHLSRINFRFPIFIRKIITKILDFSDITRAKHINEKYPNTYETEKPNSILRLFADTIVVIFEKTY